MSEKPPMPLVCRDFVVDTIISGLTLEQTGAYTLLLANFWNTKRPLPDNDKVLCRVLPVPIARWKKHIRPDIVKFFDLSGGTWLPIAGHIFEADNRRLPWSEWSVLRKSIFERDGYACTYCGTKTDKPECDHVKPVSRGGTNDPANLTTACYDCNRSKGALTLEEWGHA